jgi:hypothetical protein
VCRAAYFVLSEQMTAGLTFLRKKKNANSVLAAPCALLNILKCIVFLHTTAQSAEPSRRFEMSDFRCRTQMINGLAAADRGQLISDLIQDVICLPPPHQRRSFILYKLPAGRCRCTLSAELSAKAELRAISSTDNSELTNLISPEAALRELETMYKVYLRDQSGRFKVSHAVTLT